MYLSKQSEEFPFWSLLCFKTSIITHNSDHHSKERRRIPILILHRIANWTSNTNSRAILRIGLGSIVDGTILSPHPPRGSIQPSPAKEEEGAEQHYQPAAAVAQDITTNNRKEDTRGLRTRVKRRRGIPTPPPAQEMVPRHPRRSWTSERTGSRLGFDITKKVEHSPSIIVGSSALAGFLVECTSSSSHHEWWRKEQSNRTAPAKKPRGRVSIASLLLPQQY